MKTASGSMLQVLRCGLRGIVCLGLICIVILGAFFWLPAKVNYHVVETYIFSGDVEDAQVYLGIILPKSGPYQWVGNVEISWDGSQQEENYGFVDVIKFYGNKGPQETLVATVEYDVKLPQGYITWPAPVEDFQRLPQNGIESDCDCIQKKAASISDGTSSRDAYKVYSFTADYLTYSRDDMDCTSLSALKAYEIGTCVCAGYARLMTALCRASGIPSQMVLGLVYPDPMFMSKLSSFPQNPVEAHAWVEYYSEGSWKMADPTWGKKYLKPLQFNRNDSRHLVYGELAQILSVDDMLEWWALNQADYVIGNDKCFRFIATSTSKQVSFRPITTIDRKWDGRWLNTLVAWGSITGLLCVLRFRSNKRPCSKSGTETTL